MANIVKIVVISRLFAQKAAAKLQVADRHWHWQAPRTAGWPPSPGSPRCSTHASKPGLNRSLNVIVQVRRRRGVQATLKLTMAQRAPQHGCQGAHQRSDQRQCLKPHVNVGLNSAVKLGRQCSSSKLGSRPAQCPPKAHCSSPFSKPAKAIAQLQASLKPVSKSTQSVRRRQARVKPLSKPRRAVSSRKIPIDAGSSGSLPVVPEGPYNGPYFFRFLDGRAFDGSSG